MEITDTSYYTNSKVVLGYIANESRRFYLYVTNRVQVIKSLSTLEQWRYVESEHNPADSAMPQEKPKVMPKKPSKDCNCTVSRSSIATGSCALEAD